MVGNTPSFKMTINESLYNDVVVPKKLEYIHVQRAKVTGFIRQPNLLKCLFKTLDLWSYIMPIDRYSYTYKKILISRQL